MKKKLFFPAAIVFLAIAVAAAFFPGEKEEPKKTNLPAASEQEYKKTDKIPAHKDNEEDLKPEVLQETKKLAEQFVKEIAPINPKEPTKYLETIKPIVDQELYQKMTTNPARPTLTTYKREILDIQTFPVDDILPERKKWNVIAFVRTSDNAGNTSEDQLWYWVSVAKKAGEWKITGFEEGE